MKIFRKQEMEKQGRYPKINDLPTDLNENLQDSAKSLKNKPEKKLKKSVKKG